MRRSMFNVPLLKPEDVIPHLAKRERDWRAGYSAMELAVSWGKANCIPAKVRGVLDSCPTYQGAELIDGFFEREVDLRTRGRNSQTDLMLVLGIGSELAVVAVEGKVEEPFGQLVQDWNDDSLGKSRRLEGLCTTLGLDREGVSGFRYQLLHRTVSAIYEAQRYRSRQALMLVHSFSSRRSWFADFAAFAAGMGMPVSGPDSISELKICGGVELRVGWVCDSPSVA
jgi:hypothetical protein